MASAKYIQVIEIWYAKLSSALFIMYHAMGVAIIPAMMISMIKLLSISFTICTTEPPNTFLMPISLFFLSTIKAVKPYNPKQDITSESNVKKVNILKKTETKTLFSE